MKYLGALLLAGCAATNHPTAGDQATFDATLDRMIANDHKQEWSQAECKEVAHSFERIQGNAYALFNAGLAHRRCNADAEAKAKFEAALDLDPALKHASAQLSSLRAKETGSPEAASDAKAPPLGRNGLADPRDAR